MALLPSIYLNWKKENTFPMHHSLQEGIRQIVRRKFDQILIELLSTFRLKRSSDLLSYYLLSLLKCKY